MKTTARILTLSIVSFALLLSACATEVGPDDVGTADGTELRPPVAYADVDLCDPSSAGYQALQHRCSYDLTRYSLTPATGRGGVAYAVIPGQAFAVTCECQWGLSSGDPSCQPGQMEAGTLPTCPANDTTWTTFRTYSTNPLQCVSACNGVAPVYALDYGCCS